jgi:hypothetical protein
MGSDEPLWVGFLPFKDDAPEDIRKAYGTLGLQGASNGLLGAQGLQISSANTRHQLEVARAYQELCKNTTPIVLPTEYEECLAIAELMAAEKALAALAIQATPTIQTETHAKEPPQKKRKGPAPPPSLKSIERNKTAKQ